MSGYKKYLRINGLLVVVSRPAVTRFKKNVNKTQRDDGITSEQEDIYIAPVSIRRKVSYAYQLWQTWQDDNCTYLGITDSGTGISVLPKNKVKEFYELMDFYKNTYEGIEDNIKQWMKGEYKEEGDFDYLQLCNILQSKGIKPETYNETYNLVKSFEYRIRSLTLDPAVLKETEEELVKVARENVEDTIKSLNRALYRMVLKKIQDNSLSKKRTKVKHLKKNLEKIMEQAEGYGIKEVYEPIEKMIDNISGTLSEDRELTEEEKEHIAKEISEALGVEYNKKPIETINLLETIKEKLSPKNKKFIEGI